MHTHSQEKIPTPLLIGAAALMGLSVLGAVMARTTGIGAQQDTTAPVTERVSVRFIDAADGGVLALHQDTGVKIASFSPGHGGFVRSALRAVAFKRKVLGLGDTAPFEISRSSDGRMILSDPTSGEKIELAAFGGDNANDFAEILSAGTAVQ